MTKRASKFQLAFIYIVKRKECDHMRSTFCFDRHLGQVIKIILPTIIVGGLRQNHHECLWICSLPVLVVKLQSNQSFIFKILWWRMYTPVALLTKISKLHFQLKENLTKPTIITSTLLRHHARVMWNVLNKSSTYVCFCQKTNLVSSLKNFILIGCPLISRNVVSCNYLLGGGGGWFLFNSLSWQSPRLSSLTPSLPTFYWN